MILLCRVPFRDTAALARTSTRTFSCVAPARSLSSGSFARHIPTTQRACGVDVGRAAVGRVAKRGNPYKPQRQSRRRFGALRCEIKHSITAHGPLPPSTSKHHSSDSYALAHVPTPYPNSGKARSIHRRRSHLGDPDADLVRRHVRAARIERLAGRAVAAHHADVRACDRVGQPHVAHDDVAHDAAPSGRRAVVPRRAAVAAEAARQLDRACRDGDGRELNHSHPTGEKGPNASREVA